MAQLVNTNTNNTKTKNNNRFITSPLKKSLQINPSINTIPKARRLCYAVEALFILKKMTYNTGTKTNVNKVANPSPNIMVTAIEIKNASVNNGNIPRMVVMAAIATGIKRLTPETYTA